KRAMQYQLRQADLDKEEKVIVKCFRTHIRVMAEWPEAWSVPSDPNEAALARFNSQFLERADVTKRLTSTNSLINASLVCVYPSTPASSCQVTRSRIGQIEEHIVKYIRTMLAWFGLPSWAPNYAEIPYSLYNTAVHLIAVETFKQVLVLQAYDFLRANPKFAKNMELLFKIYDYIVHSHFHQIYLKEKREPGSVLEAARLNPIYIGRQQLYRARLQYAKDHWLPRCYQRYITLRATCDDEADPEGSKINGRPVFHIHHRPECSEKANILFRRLNEVMEKTKEVSSHRRRKDKLCVVPATSQPTLFPAIPTDMPIDYFDPTYFNALPPRLRLQVARKMILP
ncbi:hypothetical protein BKA70DRAFT_1028442, partial [Coprinopsis sp. MPI-PUGE-AT-0042]